MINKLYQSAVIVLAVIAIVFSTAFLTSRNLSADEQKPTPTTPVYGTPESHKYEIREISVEDISGKMHPVAVIFNKQDGTMEAIVPDGGHGWHKKRM